MWDWLSTWASNPASIVAALAVIALLWRMGRWTQRVEADLRTHEKLINAQGAALEKRIDTLREEVREQQVETRRTLDILRILLRDALLESSETPPNGSEAG